MAYIIAYFIINFILVYRMIKNVYFTIHEPETEKEFKEAFSFWLPTMILFGAILISMEYYYRAVDGDL